MKEKRTYRDRAESNKRAVAKRRRRVKELAVAYKGGKCEICGYSRCIWALDLHHVDPSTKEFAIGAKGYTRSWKAVQKEVDKCILVCANCHREIEAGIIKIPQKIYANSTGVFQGSSVAERSAVKWQLPWVTSG